MEPDEIIRALRLCADKSENFEECHSGQCDCPFGKTVIDCTERMNRAAADLIELLTDEIPHWIPVSERLPDKEVLVLLFLRSPKGETKITTGEIYASNNKKFDGEFCIGFDPLSPDFLNREVVTHWMPLPQPPKGEKQ